MVSTGSLNNNINNDNNDNNNLKQTRQDSMLSTGSLNSSMVSEPGSFSEATSPYRKYVEKNLIFL